jgi:hypothetical protein
MVDPPVVGAESKGRGKRWALWVLAVCAAEIGALMVSGNALAADSGRAVFSALRAIVYEKGSSIQLAGPKTVIISGENLNEVRAARLMEQGIGTFPLHFQVEATTSDVQDLRVYVPKRVDERFKGAPTEQLIVHYVYRDVTYSWSSATWWSANWLFGNFRAP